VATDGGAGGATSGSPDERALLRPPPAVVEIAQRLEEAGHETWCVGGAVRDALLGHLHNDWDLATAAVPDEVIRLFPRRTVPVGLAHGTVGVLDRMRTLHEVTTFRRDVRTDGRHAEVEFGASLDEDLARRDITINAIAYSPTRHILHDPFHGRADLGRRLVRAVGRAADRMREDRLRALRGLRFASRFEFTIDAETWEAIVASAPALTQLSAERVKEELTKTMVQVARPGRALALWRDSGALRVLVPTIAGLDAIGIATLDCLAQPRERAAGDRGVARRDARRLARLAALFLGHRAREVEDALKTLRFSNHDAAWIARIAEVWRTVGSTMEWTLLSEATVPDATVRRWVASAGRMQIASLLRLAAARWAAVRTAGGPAPTARQVRGLYRRALRSAFRDAIQLSDLAVDGSDLQDGGVAYGPLVGEMLRRLLAAVVEDQALNVRDRLLALARQWATESPSERPTST
jgi:tRNA nucleotidyltransferase (CCA-adding enzyme)